MNWIAASFASLLSFGLWGLFTKLAVTHIDSKGALIYQTIGVLIIGIITLGFVDFKPMTNIKGLSYAILTGAAYSIGCLFYFMAVSKGKAMTVVTLTALYPIITIILAYLLLKETVSMRQCLGIGLSFIAIFLILT